MSQADADRFVEDLKNNEELRAELSGQATGIASVVTFAKDKGYDVTGQDVATYIEGQAGQDLTDEQLDAIAGGKGHHHHHHHSSTSVTQTNTVQTAEVATTAVEVAEVAAVAVVVVT